MGDDALLPLRMFRSRTFSVASGQVTIIGMAMFGGLSVIPLYLQIVKGASPTKSGLLLLPLVAGMMLSSLGSGRLIARTGRYKVFPVVGSVLMVVGMGLFITLRADTALWTTDLYMAIFGIGLGMNMQSLVLAMQNAVPAQDMGVASAASSFFRSVGGTLGTAIFLSILFSQAGTKIAQQYARAATDPAYIAAAKANPGQVASLHQHLSGGLSDTSFLSGLAKPLAHPFFVGFSSAADVVFAITAVLLVGAVVLSSCLKEVPLRLVSGNQARAQASESEGAVAPWPSRSRRTSHCSARTAQHIQRALPDGRHAGGVGRDEGGAQGPFDRQILNFDRNCDRVLGRAYCDGIDRSSEVRHGDDRGAPAGRSGAAGAGAGRSGRGARGGRGQGRLAGPAGAGRGPGSGRVPRDDGRLPRFP